MSELEPAWLFATWFGCGYSPIAPGTAGSLAAIADRLAALPARLRARLHFLLLSLALLYPAIRGRRHRGRANPGAKTRKSSWSMKFWASGSHWRARCASTGDRSLLAFVLFRLFDIWKPPPIRLIERVPGGAGIVLDDMMAGVYGALVLFLVGWFNLY